MTGLRLEPGARVAVAGAGCAGCSLAAEMLARCPGVRVSVFDPAERPALCKTWCYWEITPHRFAVAVSSRWSRVAVRSAEAEAVIDASSHPYACIRASDFHRVAGLLLSVEHCTLRRGVGVAALYECKDGVEVTLVDADGGESRESFDVVFDGRPPEALPGGPGREPMLFQHFGGVELAAPEGTLDDRTVTLMDFGVPQDDGPHFMYVLPFARDRVLIESTFMTPKVGSEIDYEAYAVDYARTRLGIRGAVVVYRESGVLPMTLRHLGPPSTRRVWRIGTRAGVGRASSGYAFDAIQRDSVRIVDALLTGLARPAPPRPRLLDALDRVLLSWLNTDTSAASRVFPRLFRGAPPARLIRFLSDVPSPLDALAVAWAMPKAALLRHALSHTSAWPRSTA